MPARCSRSSSPWRALALLALAACTREPVTHPFRILVAGLPLPATEDVIQVDGTAARLDDSTLQVTPAAGPAVTMTFVPMDGVAIPASLEGRMVNLAAHYDPTSVDPDGGPLPFRGVRISTSEVVPPRARFAIGEGDSRDLDDLPLPSPLLQPAFLGDEVPFLRAVATVAFEPTSCGDAYYDLLRVFASTVPVELILDRHRRGTFAPGLQDLPDWTVVHVVSWHLAGHRSCGGKARSWVQVALWR